MGGFRDELKDVIVNARYGNEFTYGDIELRNSCGVSTRRFTLIYVILRQQRLQEESEKEEKRREIEIIKQLKKQQEEAAKEEKEQRRREKEEDEQKKELALQKHASVLEGFLKKSKSSSPMQANQPTINESTYIIRK
ncbi:hypothetical protein Tco_0452970 [Tanacetum coccineum]